MKTILEEIDTMVTEVTSGLLKKLKSGTASFADRVTDASAHQSKRMIQRNTATLNRHAKATDLSLGRSVQGNVKTASGKPLQTVTKNSTTRW